MRQPFAIHSLLVISLIALIDFARPTGSRPFWAAAQSASSYTLTVPVNEVSLTFHASDSHGLPINDLKHGEIKILDNGKPPRRVLAFYVFEDHPIRAGILMDTSQSMQQRLPASRAIAIQYAQHLLRQQTDQAFLMDFGFTANILQPWTGDPATLANGIRRVRTGKENPLAGTALYDSLFRACFYEFGKINHDASGNFILLFSDGEDNASHTALKDVVNICQQSNTAIYAFRTEDKSNLFSNGPGTLADLTSQTGGRVFPGDDSPTEVDNDLRTIEADLRNTYRLVYQPAELKPDGSFHRIALRGPERVDSISVRTGYYAPTN
jgi:VWFA-related protein